MRLFSFTQLQRLSKGPSTAKKCPCLVSTAVLDRSLDDLCFRRAAILSDCDEITAAVLLSETGDRFFQEFGFEDNYADLVVKLLVHPEDLVPKGHPKGIADSDDVLR